MHKLILNSNLIIKQNLAIDKTIKFKYLKLKKIYFCGTKCMTKI